LAKAGHYSDIWPVVLVLLAVLIPALCLLWFMSEAMRNERLAARQKLADAYRSQLTAAQTKLERTWTAWLSELERLAQTAPASSAFARCVQSGGVDSVILFDQGGKIIYPNTPSGQATLTSEPGPEWKKASQCEYLRKDFVAAARLYQELAQGATNDNEAGRARQAEARCLLQAGQKESVIRLAGEVLADQRFQRAIDPQGRLIVANVELMALELITNRSSSVFQAIAHRLQARLLDYENPALAASQRLFLMKELRIMDPTIEFPTLAAEELAAQFQETYPTTPNDAVPLPSPVAGQWQVTTPGHRVVALLPSGKLLSKLQAFAVPDNLPQDVQFAVLPPNAETDSAFVLTPAGSMLPGWRMALSLKKERFLDATAEHRRVVYLWTGLLTVAAMGVLTVLSLRLLRQHAALARLKNDLAATVSHELKTPLAAMRVLVDTLVDSDTFDQSRVREYLQLIARENERLSRLIHNFLTFSRMERRKHTFQFAPVPARQIIDSAVEAVRERFAAPDCRFEVRVDTDLPEMMADPDALTTALVNLLDNAWKYSENTKHIILRAGAQNGHIVFSVEDNGVGIALREQKRIFRRFYQVDQRLSRQGGGCGLGLSIVQFVATAHHGRASVESNPGRGSTFSISIPALGGHTSTGKDSIT